MAVVGEPGAVYSHGAESGGKSIYSTKVCFIAVGDITTTLNKGRQAGQANERSISLDVYGWREGNQPNCKQL